MPKVPSESGPKEKVQVSKAIKDSIAQAEELFGEGAAMQLGKKKPRLADSISTGCLSLDFLIGCGGIPKSYITEIFGPEGGGKSTLCLQVIAEAQRAGQNALYIDSENKLNLQYATKLGVNVGDLIVSQPQYGEAAFQIAEIFIKNKAVGIVVVDSIAMLVPKSEFEGEIGDAGVGQLSRMVTQALRKLSDQVRRSNCVWAHARVSTDKEKSERIKKIVTKRFPIKVLSVLPNGTLRKNKVYGWYRSELGDRKWVFVSHQYAGTVGQHKNLRGVWVTEDHGVHTPNGYIPAGELRDGDLIVTSCCGLNPDQESVLLGTLLGDGSLRAHAKNAQLAFSHAKKQREWFKVKADFFRSIGLSIKKIAPTSHRFGDRMIRSGLQFRADSSTGAVWNKWRERFYPRRKKVVPEDLKIHEMNSRVLATWYLDDGSLIGDNSGCLYTNCFSKDDCERLIGLLNSLGYGAVLRKSNSGQPTIFIPAVDVRGVRGKGKIKRQGCPDRFFSDIAPYVCPSMRYKLPPTVRESIPYRKELWVPPVESRLISPVVIRRGVPPHRSKRWVYCIDVAKAHNFVCDDIVLHNCALVCINQIREKIGVTWGNPETTPAGHALKHNSSVRMDVRRIQALKNGDKVIGACTKIKVVKNTFASPFQDREYDLIYGEGFSREADLIELGVLRKVIEKDGASYLYDRKRIGHGREATRVALKQQPELFQEIYGKLRAMILAEIVQANEQ